MRTIRGISVTLALLFMVSTCTFAAKGKVNKVFDKEFSVNAATKLYVQNKYGQINVENWDKNSISIHVDVRVDNSSDDKAKTMLDAIDVEFSETDNLVSAITRFNEDIMKSNKRLFSSISTDDLSIDYLIKMPKNVDIELNHRYGDIFIDELTGKVAVELKYGNIKVNKFERGDAEPLNTMVIGYGNASIGEANWLKVEIRYGKLKIDKARAAVVLSKYSKISIDNISSLVVDSKYDTYNIGSTANLVGEAGYTVFSIDELTKKFNLTAKYGDVKISNVADNFESITFNAAYTGLKAGISPKAVYSIDAVVSYGSIKYDAPIAKVNRIEGNTSTEMDGVIGGSENAKSKVYIRMKYGNASFTKQGEE